MVRGSGQVRVPVVLGLEEVWEHVLVTPTCVAQSGPVVVVAAGIICTRVIYIYIYRNGETKNRIYYISFE